MQSANCSDQLLNRAQDLKSFVKNDKDKGYIEIELKGAKGKGNLVIRRDLDIAQKTGFKLNGANASGKEINARMAELNVQVSNLWCVVLPILPSLLWLTFFSKRLPSPRSGRRVCTNDASAAASRDAACRG